MTYRDLLAERLTHAALTRQAAVVLPDPVEHLPVVGWREPMRERILASIAPLALRIGQRRSRHRAVWESLQPDFVESSERWSSRVAARWFRTLCRDFMAFDALIQGCGRGRGLPERMLRMGAHRVCATDVIAVPNAWREVNAQYLRNYGRTVQFSQNPLEETRFASGSFDVVCSEAVYEHVDSIEDAVAESHRLLRAGGLMFHAIGPLYYTFGGDHCSGDIDPGEGFNHLLLPEAEYRASVDRDERYINSHDPNGNFWAKQGIFSFATAEEYLQAIDHRFTRCFQIVVLSDSADQFAKAHPQRWARLLELGYAETDLLVKGLYVCGRKDE